MKPLPSTAASVRPLRAAIRKALERELRKMVDEGTGKINDWNPDALASWIAPGVIATVERQLRGRP